MERLLLPQRTQRAGRMEMAERKLTANHMDIIAKQTDAAKHVFGWENRAPYYASLWLDYWKLAMDDIAALEAENVALSLQLANGTDIED